MLAQLTYPANTAPSSISSDIVSALTGVTDLASYSSALVQVSSSIVATVPATWEVQTANTATTDVIYNGTVANSTGSIKALRQPVATNPSVYKYLKFGFISTAQASVPYLKLASNIGAGLTSGVLQSGAELLENTLNSTIGATVNSASALTLRPVKVIVYSDPSATLITITEDTFYEKFCFAVLDIEDNFKDVTDYVPTIHVRPNNPLTYGQDASPLIAYMPGFTRDGAVYSDTATTGTTGFIRAFLTAKNFVFDDDRAELICSEKHKFENFAQYGTRYQIMPFGVSVLKVKSIKAATPYTDIDFGEWAIPYSGAPSSVYLCNYYAFGRSGNFYDTLEGVLCKMGNFMVKVQ